MYCQASRNVIAYYPFPIYVIFHVFIKSHSAPMSQPSLMPAPAHSVKDVVLKIYRFKSVEYKTIFNVKILYLSTILFVFYFGLKGY